MESIKTLEQASPDSDTLNQDNTKDNNYTKSPKNTPNNQHRR